MEIQHTCFETTLEPDVGSIQVFLLIISHDELHLDELVLQTRSSKTAFVDGSIYTTSITEW
jgi:hypothetical protein